MTTPNQSGKPRSSVEQGSVTWDCTVHYEIIYNCSKLCKLVISLYKNQNSLVL